LALNVDFIYSLLFKGEDGVKIETYLRIIR